MFLWWVQYDNEEWGSYVIEESRGKAKAMFYRYFDEGEYTDIRCYKRKAADGYKRDLLDEPDNPILVALGVGYVNEDEKDTKRW